MPQMDPKIALLLKAHPDLTPSEATQIVYGKKTGDIALKPQPMSLYKLVFGGGLADRVNGAGK